MSNAVQSQSPRARSRRITRFVRTSIKPVVIKLSRKLSMTYWPRRRRTISMMLALLLVPFVPNFAAANPTGAQVVAGTASITRPSNTSMQVNQDSQNAIINWQSFSIGAGESVRFVQPNSSAVALNRVIGGDPSRIFGSLSSNGQVFLVNSAGVYFAPGAKVDVGGLVATTLNVSDANFMAGRYKFEAGANAGSVANYGELHGAYVVLGAPQVTNAGSIDTAGGTTALAAGGRVALDIAGDRMISLNVDAATANAAVVNSGSITADGGKVFMTANSANAVLDTVVNTSGIVRAASISNRNGEIVIDGGGAGVVSVTGTLDASGAATGAKGGTVKVLGDKVGLFAGAKLDVSGDAGGGTALVGGNFHGTGAERNASFTEVDQAAVIKADALGSGDGGHVAVWSDQHTRFRGSISAQGGAQGGDGGFVETSGKHSLAFGGAVDTRAAKGKRGELLLDPTDISITSAATSGVTGSPAFVGSGASSQLNVGDLVTALGTSNVTVDASIGGGAGSGNITVDTAISYGESNSLTLKAANNIRLHNNITNTGSGALSLNADGAIGIDAAAGISLGGGALAIAGSGGGTSLAGSFANAGTIVTGGGNVTAYASGPVSTGAISSGAGTIAITSNGAIDITGTVASTDGSINAIMMNAGASLAAGSGATGGDITLSGGSVSVGAGGRATLYTGTIAGSQTLADLIGAGSGHFRYNSAVFVDNYGVGLGTGVYAIYREQPTLTVSASAPSVVYGNSPTLSATYSGLANGDTTGQALSATATVGDDNVHSTGGYLTAGTHILTAAGAADQFGYNIVYAPGSLVVTPRGMVIAGVTASDKVYDGTTTVVLDTSGVTSTGLLVGDVASIGGVSGSFATKGAGAGKIVNLTGAISGADAANYTIDPSSTATASITQKALTISGLAVNNRTYDGTAIAAIDTSGLVTAGLVGGDDIGLSATGAFADKNVGSARTVTITSSYGGADAGNYAITGQAVTTADITPRALTVSGFTATNKTYDGTVAATVTGAAVLTGLVGSDDVTVSAGGATFSDKNAGTGKTVTFTSSHSGADVGNYTISDQTTTTADIAQKAVTVSGITAFNRVYDGGIVAIADTSGASFAGKVGGDVLSVGASGAFLDKNVGAGKTVILTSSYGGADAGNYTFTDQASTTANITPRSVTVSGITANSRVYDGTTAATVDTSSPTFGGMVAGDVLTVTATGAFADKNAGPNKSVALTSSYAGADAGNYTFIDQLTATANITPKALTVSGITVNSKVYDGSVSATLDTTGMSLTGLVGSDIVTISGTPTGTFADKNVGTGKAVILNATYGGADRNNYTIVDQAGATGDITRLGSVSWIGGASGDWSVASNWAGGAIPDMANVANVMIPAGASVAFDNTVPALSGAVQVDTISGTGNLSLAGGRLDVANTLNIGAYAQSAGILNAGSLSAGSGFGQTGGTIALAGALSINQASGAALLGDLNASGLSITSAGGIGQGAGTTVAIGGSSALDAGGADISLGNAGNTLGSVALSNAHDVSLSSVTAMQVSGTVGGALGTSSAGLTLGTTSVGGNLNVGSTAAVDQAGTVNVTGTGTINAAGDVTLANVSNTFGGALSVGGNAVQLSAQGPLTAHLASGAATLAATGALTIDGNVSGALVATSGGAIGQGTALSVSGTTTLAAAGQQVQLADADNVFTGSMTVTAGSAEVTDSVALSGQFTTTGDLSLNSQALAFGTTSVGGNLAVTAGGAVTQSGALTVAGSSNVATNDQNVTLDNAGNDFGGTLTMNALFGRVTDSNALSGQFNTVNDMTIHSGALSVSGNIGNRLFVTAAGDVTQNAVLSVGSGSNIQASGHGVFLNNASNTFTSTMTVNAASVDVADTNLLALAATTSGNVHTVSGSLILLSNDIGGDLTSSVAGGVTQALGTTTVHGSASITAGAAILLDHTDNDFVGAVAMHAGGALTVKDANTLTGQFSGAVAQISAHQVDLGTSSFDSLTLTSAGAITQSGALTVAGAAAIDGQAVGLTNAGNHIGGLLTVNAADAQLHDNGNLLAHLNVSGVADVAAGGALTVDGDVGGNLHTSSAALAFGATSVSGNLNASASGAVSQSGALNVAGTSTIAASGQSVALDNAGNDFGGALALTAGSAHLADSNGLSGQFTTSGDLGVSAVGSLSFGASTVGGNLSATVASGPAAAGVMGAAVPSAVSQTGTLQVTGTASIDAGSNGVVLADTANSFAGGVTVTAGTADVAATGNYAAHLATAGSANLAATGVLSIDGTVGGDLTTDSAGLAVGATSVGGDLASTTSGAVSQGGALSVQGATTLDATGQSVALSNEANDFVGHVTADAASLQIADANALAGQFTTTGDLGIKSGALALDASSVGGSLAVTAGGTVSQGGALAVTGTSSIVAAGQTVTLDNAGNDFGGALSLTAANAVITDANALSGHVAVANNLTTSSGALALGGSVGNRLTSTAAGDITQSGALAVGANFIIHADGHNVTLTDSGNEFGSAVETHAVNVDLAAKNRLAVRAFTQGNVHTDSDSLVISQSDIGGNLDVTARGTVSQVAGAVTVHGSTAIATTGDVGLANRDNDFIGKVTVHADGAVDLADKNILDGQYVARNLTLDAQQINLGATTLSEDLSLKSAGTVTQDGALVVGKTLRAQLSGAHVVLDNADNDIIGVLNLTAADAKVRDKNSLEVGLQTTGTVDLAAGASLIIQGTSGGNLHTTSGALAFDNTTISGNLDSTATGAVSQTGALVVAGTATISAAGQALALTNAGNDFGGALGVTAGSAQVTDKNALAAAFTTTGDVGINAGTLAFGGSRIDGKLTVTAGGNITQSGALAIGNTVNLDAGAHDVLLADAANHFNGAVSGTAANFTLRDKGVLTAGTIKAGIVDLTGGTGLQMAAGGLVDSRQINLTMLDPAGTIGTVSALFKVQPGALVTFGEQSAPVTAYFSGFPLPLFIFKNDLARAAYANHTTSIYVDNKPRDPSTDSVTAAISSEIAQVLKAAQKKADSYTEVIEQGLPIDLTEQLAYPHTGSLSIKMPACEGGACIK